MPCYSFTKQSLRLPILIRITAINRGPDVAELHLLPALWFRNDWASWIAESNRSPEKPNLKQIEATAGTRAVTATHPLLGDYILSCEGDVPLLFTENETNYERIFPGQKNDGPYVKDGINDCVVQGNQAAVNPEKQGTKVSAHYKANVGSGQTTVIRLRLSSSPQNPRANQGLNPKLRQVGILPMKTNSRSSTANQALTSFRQNYAAFILAEGLPEREAVRQAIATRRPVWQGTKGAGHLKAAHEWKAACAAILGRVN